jgi:hypothetical protein
MQEINISKQKAILKVLDYISKEIFDDDDIKFIVKEKVITPIMHMLYIQLQPYILMLIGCIIIIIISSLLSLIMFFFMYLKK